MADYQLIARSPEALGQALARLRAKRGVTQDEIAEALGISRRYIYELESGRPNLYTTRIFELLRELGAHIEIHAHVDEDGRH